MMRLFLVDKDADRRIDLGLFKFNDVANCVNAAKRRHPFLNRLETHQFEFIGQYEPGPLRHPARDAQYGQQLELA